MTAPARFTKADVKRAVSGVQAAGIPIGRVQIDPNGNISIEILQGRAKQAHDNDEWADLA